MKIAARPRPVIDGPAIAILLPNRGEVMIETLQSLNCTDGFRSIVLPASRMDVVSARNKLAKDALTIADKAPFAASKWYALWVDADAFWRPGMVKRLMHSLRSNPDIDVIAGWYSGRAEYSNPKAFYASGECPRIGEDCQVGDLVEVARVGFHFVLHEIDILKRLPEEPFTLKTEGGEDVNFCDRAREVGMRIWVDTAAMIAHVGDDGRCYFPYSGAMKVVGGQMVPVNAPVRSYSPELDARIPA